MSLGAYDHYVADQFILNRQALIEKIQGFLARGSSEYQAHVEVFVPSHAAIFFLYVKRTVLVFNPFVLRCFSSRARAFDFVNLHAYGVTALVVQFAQHAHEVGSDLNVFLWKIFSRTYVGFDFHRAVDRIQQF